MRISVEMFVRSLWEESKDILVSREKNMLRVMRSVRVASEGKEEPLEKKDDQRGEEMSGVVVVF